MESRRQRQLQGEGKGERCASRGRRSGAAIPWRRGSGGHLRRRVPRTWGGRGVVSASAPPGDYLLAACCGCFDAGTAELLPDNSATGDPSSRQSGVKNLDWV